MKVDFLSYYKDGGTVGINTDEGTYYMDYRISSETQGKLLDGKPKEKNSKEVVNASLRQEIANAMKVYEPSRFEPQKKIEMVIEAIEKI
jgi:hypothetical protein